MASVKTKGKRVLVSTLRDVAQVVVDRYFMERADFVAKYPERTDQFGEMAQLRDALAVKLTCGWCQQEITHAEIFTHPCLNKPICDYVEGSVSRSVGGCGQILSQSETYRCTHCHLSFHLKCISVHWKESDEINSIRSVTSSASQ